jgi:hypothetical protein
MRSTPADFGEPNAMPLIVATRGHRPLRVNAKKIRVKKIDPVIQRLCPD